MAGWRGDFLPGYVPDANRWVVGLGAGYVLSDKSSIDVGDTAYVFQRV